MTNTQPPPLRPCPFCGGEGIVDPHDNDTCCMIKCVDCYAATNAFSSIVDATEAWNIRPTAALPQLKPYEMTSENIAWRLRDASGHASNTTAHHDWLAVARYFQMSGAMVLDGDRVREALQIVPERESVDIEKAAKAIAARRYPHAPAVTPHSRELAEICAEAWGLQWRRG